MIRRIEGGEPPAAPEGANPIHPHEKKIRETEPTGRGERPRRTQDEYAPEDDTSKPDPRFPTYNKRGQMERASGEKDGDENSEDG